MSIAKTAAADSALLFDLDGTLVDTAPDLLLAANRLRAEHGLRPLLLEQFRPSVSRGGAAMLLVSLPQLGDAARAAELPRFLDFYAEQPCTGSRLFGGMSTVLAIARQRQLRWGVVTNKPEGLARLVLDGLQLLDDCAVLIGGDTLAQRKPHPLPLQEACRRLAAKAASCLYVGDDPRDVESALAAGMPCVAAGWGYFDAAFPPGSWGALSVADSPLDLLRHPLLGAALPR
jgi:2-phosphoglycolate phosphatase